MRRAMDFYVTEKHEQAILGFHACRDLKLIWINEAMCDDTACVVDTHIFGTETEVTSKAEDADVLDGMGLA